VCRGGGCENENDHKEWKKKEMKKEKKEEE